MSTWVRRGIVGLLACAALLLVQGTAGAVVVLFKDGFTIRGRITHAYELYGDKVSGVAIPMPRGGEPFKIDDNVRRILFCPNQVNDVLQEPRGLPLMQLKRRPVSLRGGYLPTAWDLVDTGTWNDKWERTVTLETAKGRFEVAQRVTLLTPRECRVDAVRYNWYSWYQTRELGPEAVRGLVSSYYAARKGTTDAQRGLETARFLLQAGWPDAARKELEGIKTAGPEQEKVSNLMKEVGAAQTAALVDDLQTAARVGQPDRAAALLERFFKEDRAGQVEEKTLVALQELKTKLAASRRRLEEVRGLLKELPPRVPAERQEPFARAAAAIAEELSSDSLPRLDAFLDQARSWALAVKQGRPPALTAEQVLAYALSGWIQGSDAADEKADAALDLWRARDLVLKYQREPGEQARRKLIGGVVSGSRLRPDVVARLLKYLPPPEASGKLGVDVLKMQGRLPDGGAGTPYELRLPPEYHHSRAYPVLIVLPDMAEKPGDALAKWADLAARNGFLLAAPQWGRGAYAYTAGEHAAVLGCLWDLQRRFHVDADRVFLFGAEGSGIMAYDVGLSHPDLFAGVLVMSAGPYLYAAMYTHNAQYLPLYVVDGDKDLSTSKQNEAVFRRWVQGNYPVLLAEFRGRAREWFGGELPTMMEWMTRKKRIFPQQELTPSTKSLPFQTMRSTDAHFYWLSTDAIQPRCLNEGLTWNASVRPATLQARISGGNYVHLHISGLKKVTVWLGPGMINFDREVKVQVNGGIPRGMTVHSNLETLLEDNYQRGDRQQPFLARIDVTP